MDQFYAWQCISLVRKFSTLDFVIPDEKHLSALFHFSWATLYNQTDSSFMQVFRQLKFKMKLAYECRVRKCGLNELIIDAISKTLDEQRVLSIANLQKIIESEDIQVMPANSMSQVTTKDHSHISTNTWKSE